MSPQLIGYMASFDKVIAEETVDEKRRLLRAFVRKVGLNPKTGTGRVEIYDLPVFSLPVQEKKDDPDSRPSFLKVVAGAGFDSENPSSWHWKEIELADRSK